MFQQLFFALILTLFFESIVYSVGNRVNFKTLVAVSVANIVLNLSMNFFLMIFKNEADYRVALLVCEIITTIIEAFVFFFFSKRKLWFSFLVSIGANFASWGFGNAMNYLNIYKENEALFLSSIVLFGLFTILITISGLLFFAPGLFDKQNGDNNSRGNQKSKEK